MSLRTMRYALWGTVVLVIAVVAGVTGGRYMVELGQQGATAAVDIGGPFTLVGTEGQPVTDADFEGRPRAMFFGFTHCPDVCPTTMFEAAGWLSALGDRGDDLAMIFVSVDPERDTPDVLKTYVGAFDERIVGLTGDQAAVDQVVADYRVYARKVPLENGSYTVDHSASVLLFDGNGDFHGFISYGETEEVALRKLNALLDAG